MENGDAACQIHGKEMVTGLLLKIPSTHVVKTYTNSLLRTIMCV